MKLRRRHNEHFGINATSTADISFILLIFFLITTSMDSAKGIKRALPSDEDEQEQEVEVKKNVIAEIYISDDGSVQFNDSIIEPAQLQNMLTEFVLSNKKNHIINISCAEGCVYNDYFMAQNAVQLAYRDAHHKVAMDMYSFDFEYLSEEKQELILSEYPQHISETTIVKGGER